MTWTATPAERDALVRFPDGSSDGFSEGLSLRVSLPGSRSLWLRMGLLRRTFGARREQADLWAIATNMDPAESSGRRHLALRERWEMSAVQFDRDSLHLSMGDASLDQGHCQGRLEDTQTGDSIRWDLRFSCEPEGLRHLPGAWMYRSSMIPWKMTTPQVITPVSGVIEINGSETRLEDAPGAVSHHWGRRWSSDWVWAHCNLWSDSESAVAFEATSFRLSFGPLTSPPLTVIHARIPGERITLNGLWRMMRNRSHLDGLVWEASGSSGDRRVRLRVRCEPDRLLGIDHETPEGRRASMLCTSMADAELTVE
ncbi:MAG: hypothetical protein VX938_10095 [Myxococcota bacterium]|nr:hypothetical protein [Myxococcota bacterium]